MMIKCKTCGADNSGDSRFCIVCGTPITKESTVMCPNGHIYDSSLAKCPYCPSSDLQEIMGYGKTVSSDAAKTIASSGQEPASRIMGESNKPAEKFQGNKTIIAGEDGEPAPGNTRKLVGWLVTFSWNKNGDDYKLYEGRNIISGGSDSDIRLNDPAVSSPHCLILFRDGKFRIKDQLSTNGTKINGESMDEGELKDGDILKLGKTDLKFKAL
ncbi:MAG TPA: FHA domain-containing protein [Ignavibacteria bacterium]